MMGIPAFDLPNPRGLKVDANEIKRRFRRQNGSCRQHKNRKHDALVSRSPLRSALNHASELPATLIRSISNHSNHRGTKWLEYGQNRIGRRQHEICGNRVAVELEGRCAGRHQEGRLSPRRNSNGGTVYASAMTAPYRAPPKTPTVACGGSKHGARRRETDVTMFVSYETLNCDGKAVGCQGPARVRTAPTWHGEEGPAAPSGGRHVLCCVPPGDRCGYPADDQGRITATASRTCAPRPRGSPFESTKGIRSPKYPLRPAADADPEDNPTGRPLTRTSAAPVRPRPHPSGARLLRGDGPERVQGPPGVLRVPMRTGEA